MSRGPHAYLTDAERASRAEAMRLYRNARNRGELIPQPCIECGAADTHGHHAEGYDKPLTVTWLCAKHHGMAHLDEHQRRFRESYHDALRARRPVVEPPMSELELRYAHGDR